MANLRFTSKEEIERLIEHLMKKAEKYELTFTAEGTPCLVLQSPVALVVDTDGTVTWTAKIITYTAHAFIELTTGSKKTKTIYLPICLLNPKTRIIAEALIGTTIDPLDGRFGSKNAEFFFGTSPTRLFKIAFDLTLLALEYTSLEMSSGSFLSQLKSAHCPFCTEVFGKSSGDDYNE